PIDRPEEAVTFLIVTVVEAYGGDVVTESTTRSGGARVGRTMIGSADADCTPARRAVALSATASAARMGSLRSTRRVLREPFSGLMRECWLRTLNMCLPPAAVTIADVC